MLRTHRSEWSLARLLAVCVPLAMIYVVMMRLIISASLPMWLDETWSAMIATRPDWTAFWREAWLDCNPPLYYAFLKIWVSLFGDSNFMLRLPSMLFVLSAAALPLIWRPRGLSRTGSLIWAALIALWEPGLEVVVDARGYGLMLLLSTASCLVVVQLLDRLTLGRAAAWVALGTMMFLTHYYAGVLILGQVLVLLNRHKMGLLRIWPAALIAIPGLVWFAYHLPRLKDYARPDVIWYDPTTFKGALGYLIYALGIQNFVTLAIIVAICAAAVIYGRKTKSGDIACVAREDGDLILAAATAGIGFAVAILVGFVQASLTHRYFIPLVPPAMLALTLVTLRSPRPELLGALLAYSLILPALNPQVSRTALNIRAIYGYQQTSDFIQTYKPDQLLFLWDHPGTKIMDQKSLQGIGGYFMKRAGHDIPVQALVVPLAADANAMLRAAAHGKRPGFIWLYDTARRSAARGHMPTFENDPAWKCRHWTRKTIRSNEYGSIACVRVGGEHD